MHRPGKRELEWQYKTHKKITSTPAIDDGVLYFVDGDGYLLRPERPGWQ